MSSMDDVKRGVERLQRSIDEAYSRYAGAGEKERIDGIAMALQGALIDETAALQPALLDALAEAYETPDPEPAAPQIDAGRTAELAALRLEIDRLERQQHRPSAAAASTSPALAEVLLGRDAERNGDVQQPDEAIVASVVQALVGFAVDLGLGFLATGTKPGDTARHRDHIKSTIRGELLGSLPAGSLADLLGHIKSNVGVQLQAFPKACADGARQMLKELDPLVLEDRASEGGALAVGGFRPFRHREAWEMFCKKYQELASSEDLFRTYFDGPLQKHLFRLRESKR
jgi:hypothetical protein